MSSLNLVVIGIDTLNKKIGQAVAWLGLCMVLMQFSVVLLRYIFGIGSIWVQESVIYLHAALFMLGAGATLLYGGHVRVDIFYREASPRHKALVDLIGSIFLLIPVCILIIVTGFPYVEASWRILEQSKETSGIPAVYLLKTLILVMAGLLTLQAVSMALRSALMLQGHEVPSVTEGKN